MARNVEIKAALVDFDAALARAGALADRGPELIEQDDTFFACPHGRLKLRAFADGRGELIAYQRPDAHGPKTSDYTIAPVADPAALRTTLERALGSVGRVVKRRTLFLVGRTRVHLDRVAGLGDFLELEVVLRDGEAEAAGTAEAHALLERLGIAATQLVATAYVDLLRERGA
ncbi:MAG TPA: class IV adenylate cyclase [Burkholderiaceae bacterium]